MNLSEADCGKLANALEKLNVGMAFIRASVLQFRFPQDYELLIALMERQKVAVSNMLAGREAGFEIAALDPDFSILVTQAHLQNLAYTAEQARSIEDEPEQSAFVEARSHVLHNIKNVASYASLAYMHLMHVIERRGE